MVTLVQQIRIRNDDEISQTINSNETTFLVNLNV